MAAWCVGVLAVGGSLFVGFASRTSLATTAVNRWSFVGLAACAAALLWRLGGVRATPSPQRLVVRNILRTRRLDWPQIVAVRMSLSDPWVMLDLADGTTQPVMAVQRADGKRGIAEAGRLAALVRQLGEAPDPR
ncbi:PH domain-containing protein [Xylanimonas allomyrinae]|uniref:PH domain-containing protein n=1 Tax=Xylanimonas allomyrinae TaxID=2509459 RepID=UPI001FE62E8C|nr:PH domain-containing protein [Xylanimonas allomyrinae]